MGSLILAHFLQVGISIPESFLVNRLPHEEWSRCVRCRCTTEVGKGTRAQDHEGKVGATKPHEHEVARSDEPHHEGAHELRLPRTRYNEEERSVVNEAFAPLPGRVRQAVSAAGIWPKVET